MPEPLRHLHVVVDDNGEVVQEPPEIVKLREDLANAERELRRHRRRIAELERDEKQERLDYDRRDEVERVCLYWWRKCRGSDKRVNPITDVRFDAVRRMLESTRIEVVDGKRRRVPAYETEAFKEAIDGAAFDHYTKERKNGSRVHYDDLELICRDGKHFEEFRSRCPVDIHRSRWDD
jgi:hypothetical protein